MLNLKILKTRAQISNSIKIIKIKIQERIIDKYNLIHQKFMKLIKKKFFSFQ